jgi:hypothetical protein
MRVVVACGFGRERNSPEGSRSARRPERDRRHCSLDLAGLSLMDMRTVVPLLLAICVAACNSTPSNILGDGVDRSCAAVGGVQVTPPSASLHLGDTLRVTVRVGTCAGTSSTDVRWLSSDTTVALVDSLAGLVQARHAGTATIVASAVVDPHIQGALALQVTP